MRQTTSRYCLQIVGEPVARGTLAAQLEVDSFVSILDVGGSEAEQNGSLPGDHQLFVCRDDPRGHLAFTRRNASFMAVVGLFIKSSSQPRGRSADPLSDFGEFSPIPAVKTSRQPAQDRGECADLFCGTIYEVINGERRVRFRASEKIAHIVAHPEMASRPDFL